MTITREQFHEAFAWDDWLEVVDERRDAWRERYETARLGELRAAYQDVPAPRRVLCIVDAADTDSVGTVPYIAKACAQSGAAAGVELRIAPVGRGADLIDQYRTDDRPRTPICVVFDDDWIQVGHWGPRPRAAAEWLDDERAAASGPDRARALDGWYERDAGRSTLGEFLDALRGEAARPWQATERRSEHLWKQAERERRRRD